MAEATRADREGRGRRIAALQRSEESELLMGGDGGGSDADSDAGDGAGEEDEVRGRGWKERQGEALHIPWTPALVPIQARWIFSGCCIASGAFAFPNACLLCVASPRTSILQGEYDSDEYGTSESDDDGEGAGGGSGKKDD